MQLPQLIAFLSLSAAFVAGAPAAKCRTNTFTNGNFDHGTLSPWVDTGSSPGCTISLHHPGANKTKGAASLNALASPEPGSEFEGVNFQQTIDLCPNTAYTLKFLYMAASSGQDSFLNIFLNATEIYGSQEPGSIPTTYTPITVDFTTGSSATNLDLDFEFGNLAGTAASLYVDSITLVAS